ncbi:copper resistance protein Crd2 [Penicillium digitatum]|uniref:Copper resistance protein Crd2 n=1 Tax=Penicillium digitatum TaxID=36651 RepID=A0A7T7BHG3_PENDI|nr:copper resistance protein Crd2 [Penicillium digitatum]
MVHPTITCCKITKDGSCVCAAQAKCSCGQQSALHCSCNRASSENVVSGPRCSCRSRPAGQCTCERSVTENQTITGETCACGSRPQASCTCEKAAAFDSALEVDFTGAVLIHLPHTHTQPPCFPRNFHEAGNTSPDTPHGQCPIIESPA